MQVDNLVTAPGTTTHETRRNPRARTALTLGALLIAGGTILFGQLGNAQSEPSGGSGSSSRAGCSNRTLRGSYALNIDGTIIAGPNRLLLRGVAIRQFDGHGNVSQLDFTTINGAPAGTDWRSGSGTYELNSDCTGAMEIIQSDGSPTLHLRLVVGDHGRTTYDVSEGNSTGATGTKVD
jgi:hypothetical protein